MADSSWHIDIRPWAGAAATVGTWVATAVGASHLSGGLVANSTGALNDSIAWDVPLTAGTWRVTTIFEGNATNGDTATAVQFAGVTVGTINQTMGPGINTVSQISGISVASEGIVRLAYVVGSGPSRFCRLQHITLSRTA